MSRDVLFVQAHQSQWEVKSDTEQSDHDFPRYDKREDAIDAAILSARNSSKRGRAGDVYVDDGDGYKLEHSAEPEH